MLFRSIGATAKRTAVWDNRVHVSQQVVRESTGETVYRIFDIEDDDEWLLLTFAVSNKVIRE